MRLSRLFSILLTIILALALYSPATAQDEGQEEQCYIVQAGDSLWQIAARFGVTVEDLQQANNISDPGQVVIGWRLVIPGLSGINGRLDTITISYGETLRSLSRRYGISAPILARLNRLVSLAELHAGATLIVPVTETLSSSFSARVDVAPGQSLLELAVLRDKDPWSLALENNLSSTWVGLTMDVLHVAGDSQRDAPTSLPEAITKVEIDPLLLIQGGTTVIKVFAPTDITMRGSLAERKLNFFHKNTVTLLYKAFTL